MFCKNKDLRFFFSEIAKENIAKLAPRCETAQKLIGVMQQNYCVIENIVSYPKEDDRGFVTMQACDNMVIGLLAANRTSQYLPSDKIIRAMQSLFPGRKAILLMYEKSDDKHLIHPFIHQINGKMRILESVELVMYKKYLNKTI